MKGLIYKVTPKIKIALDSQCPRVSVLTGLLPSEGLTNADWQSKAAEQGMSKPTFYRLRKELENGKKIHFSKVTEKWQLILKK